MTSERRTRTATGAADGAAMVARPYLVRSLSSDHPERPQARWSLAELSEVTLSGSGPIGARRDGKTLAITCDDAWVSTRHATLRKSFGRWILEDVGSKNGTLVGGVRVTRQPLADGDLIEVGRTSWWFRELAMESAVDDVHAIALGEPFVTLHAPLEADLARARRAIAARIPILVIGETGSGKERFVGALHASSGRAGMLVAVNCAALPATLVEGELFGHRKGAFSGAVEDRLGYIRSADRGTLFLDEIGDMPASAQAALLRVLSEHAVTPVGGERPIAVDLVVVSATHRRLDALANTGAFRPDLLARIRGVSITVPALRERREDIGLFVARAIARVAPNTTLQPDAARALLQAPWSLNVRELDHAVAVAALRAAGRAITTSDLEGALPSQPKAPASEVLTAAESALRDRVVAALAANGGNISAVARELGRDRKQIHRWIARFSIKL